jgi:endonuclease/exonuclease/phosphatase (EEP) superfamily protein YafD
MFKILGRRIFENMTIILAGDFNVNVKDNYDAELVYFMKDTFELEVLLDFSHGATRYTRNSRIDMVFGRNVDNLSCKNYVSYFSCHRPILNRSSSTH